MKIVILLSVILIGNGCSGSLPEHGAYKDYNVIIILIDALRYDHLGCYGYKRDTSPNIDALSKESLVFTNAIAQGTWTKPSVVSLFTSSYVKDHGVVNDFVFRPEYVSPGNRTGDMLPSGIPTLVEVLKTYGYKTKALIGNKILSAKFGLERGFDEYTASDPETTQTMEAIDWVKIHGNSKFFMYLHYLAPHAPYGPPSKYKKRFKPEYKGKFDFRGKLSDDFTGVNLSQEEKNELVARYDGEICYADFELGRFISFLREQNLLKKTILIVSADHGEALGENGPIGHPYPLNTVVQVPLIIFPAQGRWQKTIDDVVGLIDVAPSILGLLGIEAPPFFKGTDLFHISKKNKKGFEFSDDVDTKQQIIRNKDFIFKYHTKSGEIKLYNLKTDPFEFKDISKDNAELIQRFMSAKNLFMSKHAPIPVGAYVKDKDSAERLRALGYLQ